jgi:hypothetical protein
MPGFLLRISPTKQWLKRPSVLGFIKLKAENAKKGRKGA